MCVTCFDLDPFNRLGITELLPHLGAIDPLPPITVWPEGPTSFGPGDTREEVDLLSIETNEDRGAIMDQALATLATGATDVTAPGMTPGTDVGTVTQGSDDTPPPAQMDGATAFVAASGNPIIDGVLYTARWNEATITYSFPQFASDYEPGYYRNAPDEDFGQISLAQQALISAALDGETFFSFEGFTLANVEYAGFSADATIRAAYSSDAGGSAYAYLPSSNYAGGDMWFGPDNGYNYANPVLGSTSWRSTLHEIGHALGLKHGHSVQYGRDALPEEYNHHEYSLMTYYSWEGKGRSGYTNEQWGYPQTFMMADIAALQYMYGADFTLNGGDTVYTFSQDDGSFYIDGVLQATPGGNRIFFTLWDGNGEDTYDLSNYTSDLDLDLNAGGHSDFNSGQSAFLGFGGPNGGYARGNVYNALMYEGDTRSLVENAIGGSGDDEIVGNQVDNILVGNAGADTLRGNDGDDILVGGAGADVLDGGDGLDLASYSEDTADMVINLGQGTVSGGTGTGDVLIGIEAVLGGSGDDSIQGDTQDNILLGGAGDDTLKASLGADSILGGAGDDNIAGGAGDDELRGAAGRDMIKGGTGADRLFGGADKDTLLYQNDTTGIRISLTSEKASGGEADGDEIKGFENVTGGSGDDFLRGNGERNVLIGGTGADTLRGEAGNDVLVGQKGADLLVGDAGNDTLKGGKGSDILEGGAGDDVLRGSKGADVFIFGDGDGDDTLVRFETGVDTVRITGGLDASDVTFQNAGGGDTLMTLSTGDTILFTDISVGDLSGFNDFEFI